MFEVMWDWCALGLWKKQIQILLEEFVFNLILKYSHEYPKEYELTAHSSNPKIHKETKQESEDYQKMVVPRLAEGSIKFKKPSGIDSIT